MVDEDTDDVSELEERPTSVMGGAIRNAVRPEDKFKLSMLNMEKRFIDMEFAISELASRVKDINPENIETYDNRIEALEDMITVEQAGVGELKQIMERVDEGFTTSATLRDIEDMRERVRRVENLARAAAEMTDLPAEMSEETKHRMKSLEDGVAELKDKTFESVSPMEVAEMRRAVGNIDERVTMMRMCVDDLKRSIDKRVQDGIKGAQITTADFDFINTKINSVKSAIDMLSDKRIENEMKISALEQRLSTLHAGQGDDGTGMLSEKFLDELKSMRRDVETAKLRMESVERVTQETSHMAQEAEKAARRFEGFERLSGLKNEVDDKLQQFRAVQSEISNLSNRVESMYEGVEKRFAELRGAEREMHDMGRVIADTRRDIDELKLAAHRTASKEDLAKVAVGSNMAGRLEGKVAELEDEVRRMDKSYEHLQSSGGVSNEVLSVLKEMDDRLENAEQRISEVQKSAGGGNVVSATGLLGPQDIEGRFNDVIDKLIFLESRLSAVEAVYQTSSKTHAMVIE
ncbi:MAG: hypothetical protein NT016_00590 [Candidatus Aenigmarchaeota archaeon]|nr:hypothetical protein [Candidatus Aenigmarchaeota archaeon]